MLIAVILAILVSMALVLIRAFKGPALYNRVLAINVFGTKTVLIISVLGVISEEAYLFDIALLYALVNFITTIAVLRLTHIGELWAGMDEEKAR